MKNAERLNDTTAARAQGRPRLFDESVVLDRAVQAFREHGYGGTSIDILRAATGLTAGSLYKAFRSKKELFSAAFDRYVDRRHGQLSVLLGEAPNGRERIAEVLRFYLDSASGAEGRRGCLVLVSLAQTSALDAAQRQALENAIARNRATLVTILQDGQQDGSIRSDLRVETCADLLLNLLQGLRAIGKIYDPTDRKAFVALALKTID